MIIGSKSPQLWAKFWLEVVLFHCLFFYRQLVVVKFLSKSSSECHHRMLHYARKVVGAKFGGNGAMAARRPGHLPFTRATCWPVRLARPSYTNFNHRAQIITVPSRLRSKCARLSKSAKGGRSLHLGLVGHHQPLGRLVARLRLGRLLAGLCRGLLLALGFFGHSGNCGGGGGGG